MRSITNIFLLIICLAVVSSSQKVEIKDADNNILMEVNDEGSSGSILLMSGDEPTSFRDKLYNIGGAIYWNGLKLITDSDAGEWTLNGLNLYPTHLSSRVGIGMDGPSRTLEVQFNTGSGNTINPIAWFRTAGTGNSAGSIGFQNTIDNYYTVGITQGTSNDFAIAYNKNISLSSDLLRLKSDGFLGLGTIDPQVKFHIIGDARIEDTTNPSLQFFNDATNAGFIGTINSDFYLSNNQIGNLYLKTENTTRLTIDEVGKVGIGDEDPTEKLDINGRMKVGDDPVATSVDPGTIRYNTTTNDFEGYNGRWVSLTRSSGPIGSGKVTDIDGNEYLTVTLGTQIWMRENLRVTHYQNGDPIPEVLLNSDWEALTTGAWCWHDHEPERNTPFGKLYNWHAVADNRGLCPTGWHVPSFTEWETLIDSLGGLSVAGMKMKTTGTLEAGTGYWFGTSSSGTNESGFTGLPGGSRYYTGVFTSFTSNGNWWSSTEAGSRSWGLNLYYDFTSASWNDYDRRLGFSVRCLKD